MISSSFKDEKTDNGRFDEGVPEGRTGLRIPPSNKITHSEVEVVESANQ
jgi:hypothetical protein